MCVIVDVNVASRVLLRGDDPDYGALHNSLFGDKRPIARLAHGGKLTKEYLKNDRLRRVLVALSRAARTRLVADKIIESETRRVAHLCTCNDKHVIALARAGGVRILCSDDRNLRMDFGSKILLDRPRGKVYRHPEHQSLLIRYCKF
jgi:hypothetical protein